jgi:hypothetical protein
MKKATTLGIIGGVLLLSASAMAEDTADGTAPAAVDPAPAGDTMSAPSNGAPPITGVRAGGIAVWGSLNVSLSKELVGKPLGISPDVLYGVNEKLAIALVHSQYGTTGFAGGAGTSLCLAGDTSGCPDLYRNVGILALYEIMPDLAFNGGLVISQLSDPMLASLKLGVQGRAMAGPVMIMYAPNILIGITERDFNKELLNLPVSAMMPAGPVMAGIQTGISGPLKDFGDFYRIPLSLMGIMPINEALKAGVALTFENIAGKGSSADFRTLNIFVGWNN